MSVSAQERKTVNDSLGSLQRRSANGQVALEWLVIAHNDAVTIRRLAAVVRNQSAAMLRVPQCDWKFSADGLRQTVKWGLSETKVKHLLVVGHSKGGPPTAAETWIDHPAEIDATHSLQPSYIRLLNGAKQVEDEIQRSKDHFVEQIVDLCEIEPLQNALLEGQTQLHTLFYISQSGTFLLFDRAAKTFRMIGD